MFDVLYEDAELLVVNKPADLVCHPTKGDAFSSLISRLRLYLGEGSHPQLVNRLDRETSGVVLVAKNAVTARELRIIWEERQVQKEYLAIVHGIMRESKGVIDAPLGRDLNSAVAIKDMVRPDGTPARTDFTVLRQFRRPEGEFSLLQLQPLTGRKHQLRIHLAHYGHPIVGDKLYGGDERIYLAFVKGQMTTAQKEQMLLPNQALHAQSVRFTWRDREWHFQAEPEPWFREFLTAVV